MTTRDTDALNVVTKWANSGDVASLDGVTGMSRAEGWGSTFSDAGGPNLSRERWNQLFREITGMLVEINAKGGVLPWDGSLAYAHPALVMGSNGTVYLSVRDSTNQDPTADNGSNWRTFLGSSSLNVVGVTDFDSITLPAGQRVGTALVEGIAGNAPMGYTDAGILVMMSNHDGSLITQQVYPLEPFAGDVSYFQRFYESSAWRHWGAYPQLMVAYVSQPGAVGQQISPQSVNISELQDLGVGRFRVHTELAHGITGGINSHATSYDTGRSVAYVTNYGGTTWDVNVFRANTSFDLRDPSGLSLVQFVPARQTAIP